MLIFKYHAKKAYYRLQPKAAEAKIEEFFRSLSEFKGRFRIAGTMMRLNGNTAQYEQVLRDYEAAREEVGVAILALGEIWPESALEQLIGKNSELAKEIDQLNSLMADIFSEKPVTEWA